MHYICSINKQKQTIMGWESTTIGKVRSVDFFKKEISGYGGCEVIDCEMVGTVIYGAVKQESSGKVIAVIWLTQRGDSDARFNFSWKEMTESMHPYYYGCPDKILDVLSATEDENSNKWRRLCRESNLQVV